MTAREPETILPIKVDGTFPVEFTYTMGVAGERFFREIKANGRLVGTLCRTCDLLYMPPRLYCERCFARLEDWKEIPHTGLVYTFTTAGRSKPAEFVGLVKFQNVHGGLLHFLKTKKKQTLRIGAKARVVFAPKARRRGSMLDIKYFEILE